MARLASGAMHRAVLAAALFSAALAAACAPDTPPSPTPAQLAARVYTLEPRQVPGYDRTTDSAISPQTLADQDNDPGIATRLDAEGFSDGAIQIYSAPTHASPPFATLSFQAIIFDDATGASAFFGEEQARIDHAPARGTISPLEGLVGSGVDQIVGYDSTQPSAEPTGPTQRAFIALMRKGRVIVEAYGYAGPNSAVPGDFIPYVTAEQELIQQPPQA